MNLYKHLIQQPFVAATGVAALVHSTWSLGTLFSGDQPAADLSIHFIGWIVPAFLIAFALDVGQVVTSAEIRAGQRTPAKYATFAVFAAATYYLQWLYIAHHMPELSLAAGVRASWGDFTALLRDAAIWIIPALLPLSTLLYTFSHQEPVHPVQQQQEQQQQRETIQIDQPESPLLDSGEKVISALEVIPGIPAPVVMTCPDCDWSKEYPDQKAGKRGLRSHQVRCDGTPAYVGNGKYG